MQTYICKCGKTFEKSSNAETTGYVLDGYSPEHKCYGCPYIVIERDWKTNDIIKRECRATPQITYGTRCMIKTKANDFSACHLYSLDLVFVKRVFNFINSLEGAATVHKIPDEWRAADFGRCYAFGNCYGLAIFPLFFQKNAKGTAARRAVMERFFTYTGVRKNKTESAEKEDILQRIEIAKENAVKAANTKPVKEETKVGGFNISAFISQQEQLKQIGLDMLIPYHNHKFKLYDDERLDDMVDSIRKNGVLEPIIVRPAADGKYEILAGHNRCNAAKLAGFTTVPGVIKENLSDEEAEMYVIETNVMQRGFDDLRISERAAVVAMRHNAMFSEDKRRAIERELAQLNGETVEDDAEKKSKLAATGEEYGLGKNTVARLIRIDTLIEPLKEWIDSKRLSMRAGVELSYISETAQTAVSDKHRRTDGTMVQLDEKTAKRYRNLFEGFTGTEKQAADLLHRESVSETEKAVMTSEKPIKISMQPNMFRKYFTADTKPQEIADTIEKALEMYFANTSDNEDKDIETLNLPVYTYNILKRQRIDTVSELKKLMSDISTAENILGRKIVAEVKEKLDV